MGQPGPMPSPQPMPQPGTPQPMPGPGRPIGQGGKGGRPSNPSPMSDGVSPVYGMDNPAPAAMPDGQPGPVYAQDAVQRKPYVRPDNFTLRGQPGPTPPPRPDFGSKFIGRPSRPAVGYYDDSGAWQHGKNPNPGPSTGSGNWLSRVKTPGQKGGK